MVQYVVDQPHEHTRCIPQPKWHDQPFIQPFLRVEGRLPFITFSDSNLMISTLQVDIGEVSIPTQIANQVIHHPSLVMETCT